jgi:16S rRNA processing protein RimM
MPDRRILMGVVGRPHGVRGLVHVNSYTADPTDLAGYGPLLDDAGRAWTLAWRASGVAELRDAAGRPVQDRGAAERLVNTKLWMDRDRLPPPEEGEFYLADLVGMAALDPAGTRIGRVTVVHDYGAGTSLEIERPGAAPLLVPFTHACVPHVDPAAGTLVVAEPDEIMVEDTAEAAE